MTVILTKDEELHIGRAIQSVAEISNWVLVVDSGSSDRTVAIAKDAGAMVLVNEAWVNQAVQFNWALDNLPVNADWILRLDADEFVTPELSRQIEMFLDSREDNLSGVYVQRRIAFIGKAVRWGGVFPVPTLRLFKRGLGRSEERWMDEHIVVAGRSTSMDGEIIDDNRKPVAWWIRKHNDYSSREVAALVDGGVSAAGGDEIEALWGRGPAGRKRWLKNKIYVYLPYSVGPLLYAFYRVVIRLGFLDGWRGTAFHLLQGFWYRYLVNVKLGELRLRVTENGESQREALETLTGIALSGVEGRRAEERQ